MPDSDAKLTSLENTFSVAGAVCQKTSAMVRTTSDKQIARTFQGQLTVFKDYDFFNKSAFLNPLLKTYYSVFTLSV